jgi:hypothetical protein
MATVLRADIPSDKTQQSEGARPGDQPRAPLDQIARLSALYDESAETALLANLLGRAPYAAVALLLCAGAVVASGRGQTAACLTWLVLVAAAAGAIARSWRHATRAPFERLSLRVFAGDLRAIMLYAGFAWGAGAFMALSVAANLVTALVFAAGTSAILAVILRAWDVSACFVLPAALLTAAAVPGNRAEGGLAGSAAVLGAGLMVAALAWLVEKMYLGDRMPPLAVPQISAALSRRVARG